jgi:hypothetical protein
MPSVGPHAAHVRRCRGGWHTSRSSGFASHGTRHSAFVADNKREIVPTAVGIGAGRENHNIFAALACFESRYLRRPAIAIETVRQLHEHHPRRTIEHARQVTLAGQIVGNKRLSGSTLSLLIIARADFDLTRQHHYDLAGTWTKSIEIFSTCAILQLITLYGSPVIILRGERDFLNSRKDFRSFPIAGMLHYMIFDAKCLILREILRSSNGSARGSSAPP